MIRYILRRILIGGITLLLITCVVYAIIRNIPGDVVDAAVAAAGTTSQKIRAEDIAAMRRQLGLDRHWTIGYLEWLGELVRGRLGRSVVDPLDVADIIGPRLGPTLLLSGTSLVLAFLLSIPLGLWSGIRSGTAGERTLSGLLYALYSLPTFVAALYLLLLFSVRLDWLPLSGLHDSDEVYLGLSTAGKAWNVLRHMVLPVACYTYGALAYYVRFIRSNLQEALRQDYIRTARAKGLGERAVVVRHAFRNSLIPLVTLLGMTLPALLGGSVVLERVFRWPGLGNLLVDRITGRDFPVVMAIVLLFSVLVLVGNFLADILYAAVDPRIRTT